MNATGQPRVRQFYGQGKSILARLLPDDEVVVVKKLTEEPLRVPADPKQSFRDAIRDLAQYRHAVLVVDVKQAEPRFVDNSSWLVTDVTLRTHETLNERPEWRTREATQTEFSLRLDGGEIVVDRVLVKVGDYALLRAGRRYIVGANVQRDRSVFLNPIFAIDSAGRVVPEATWSDQTSVPVSPLHGRTVDEIARQFARLK